MEKKIVVEGVFCGGCEARLGRVLSALPQAASVVTGRPETNPEGEHRGFATLTLKEGAVLTEEELKEALESGKFQLVSLE